MKKVVIMMAFAAIMLCAMEECFAQNRIVEGPNLNIGTNNTLAPNLLSGVMGNAIGLQNMTKSYHALAVGSNDTIDENSNNAIALGNKVKITGLNSIGIGHYVYTHCQTGMVIGSGVFNADGSSGQHLVNSTDKSLVVGFYSTKPTLFVGPSPNNYRTGIIDRTGKVAIGNVTPTAKLHIRSDDGEDAGIILEPYDPTANETFIQLRDGQHQIMVDRHGTMELSSDNNLLGVSSTNFVIDGNLLKLGTVNHRTFTFLSDNTSSIGWNASPLNGYYTRGDAGSSYVLEFSDAALKVRTAPYEEPRRDPIENWTDALTLGVGGAVTLNGRVGVNIENSYPGYALAVDGGILTTKVHIQEVSRWEDRVFGEDYRLMPLSEVEAYVAANRHLPGVPSEAEVKADGYDVAEMQAVLLGKIEELTLHVIRQQKEIDSLRTLVTVRFGYDACGNRVSRTLEFSRMEPEGAPDGMPSEQPDHWQAELSDRFEGVETMLSPNPTDGGFILSMGGDIPQGAKAILCTMDGKVLEERSVNNATEGFDLGGKPAGIYLLRLSSQRETKIWKIIKRN
jgi:hypothetical protein